MWETENDVVNQPVIDEIGSGLCRRCLQLGGVLFGGCYFNGLAAQIPDKRTCATQHDHHDTKHKQHCCINRLGYLCAGSSIADRAGRSRSRKRQGKEYCCEQ